MFQETYLVIVITTFALFCPLQGREKDYIILSCVRSNEHQVRGWLGGWHPWFHTFAW